MNWKRICIALITASVFGVFCAYGTSTVDIPNFEITMAYLLTIFYARLLIGVFVGIADALTPLKGKYQNAALRGAVFGLITSVSISFYGGGQMFIPAGIIYGILTDLIATRFG